MSAKQLFEKYKKFVENNVETIGHLESAARILSYIVPGIVFWDAFIWLVLITLLYRFARFVGLRNFEIALRDL